MASPLPASPKVRFGAFELDAAAGKLFKSGIPIKLQPQPLRVLLLLTERPGQVVTREEIQRCLWGDSTFVDFERGINFSINQIRGVLSDNAEKPRYIETLPRIGYRFIAPVSNEGLPEHAIAASASVPSAPLYGQPAESTISSTTSSDAQALLGPQIPITPWKRSYVLAAAIAGVAAVAMVGFGVQTWLSRGRKLDLQSMQITKLTDSGTAGDVAISPDGRYVVYALRDGEKEGLSLRQVATKSDIQILPYDTNGFHGLTFSPDGSYIYLVRSDKNDPFFKYLYSVPALGGPVRKLISDVDSPVGFSPDGHQFAYEHCIPSHNDLQLKITDAVGGGERLLATIHNASCFLFQPGLNWSPDGTTIAVPALLLHKQQRWVLYLVSTADGSMHELFSGAEAIGHPVWLPGGNTLLVPRYDDAYHRAQLWTVSLPGGEARRFTNDLSDYGADLDITRDARTIAAVARTTVANVWVAPAGDSLRGQQITSGDPLMVDIAEAADGRLLSLSGQGELWIMNPDGTQRAPFTDLQHTGWLTPCGRFVVFASHEAGSIVLIRVNTDGSHATTLVGGSLWGPTCATCTRRAPACSPDGRFVFYVNAEQPQKIWRIPIEGGTAVEIAEVLGDMVSGRLSISPDGNLLAYAYEQFTVPPAGWNLTVIPVGGGAPIAKFKVPGGIGGPRWSPDGRGLQYLLTHDGATNIWEQLLVGGEPQQLTKFTSGLIFDFNWSSDYTKLLLTRGSISSDVVLLTNPR